MMTLVNYISKRLSVSYLIAVILILISIHLFFLFTSIPTTKDTGHSASAICNVLNSTTCSPSQAQLQNTTISPSTTQPVQLTIETDKKTYGFGDYVEISGSVSKVVEGKTVRIDVYKPDNQVVPTLNESLFNGSLSNVRVKPIEDGSFSFKFQIPSPIIVYSSDRGVYTISATYVGSTVEAKFTVR
jgi:hypothetical protein